MCAVSVILKYGSEVPVYKWTKEILDDYKALIEKAKEIDTKIGEPDCEDESKGKWIKEVEQKIEKRKKMTPTKVPFEDLPQ